MAASYGQYNTHGAQEQLKLLQGLGNLLRHQISALHNKTATHWLKQVTDKYEYCSSHDMTRIFGRVSGTKVKLQGKHSVIKVTNSFYSGKDLCRGEFQLLLYSTWVALPIDGCQKGLILYHHLNHVTVAILHGDKCNCQSNKSFLAVHQ